jgi:hypothetical protein
MHESGFWTDARVHWLAISLGLGLLARVLTRAIGPYWAAFLSIWLGVLLYFTVYLTG